MKSVSLMLMITLMAGLSAAAGPEIDLSEAEVFATIGENAEAVIDGDEATRWAGDGNDLANHPANIFVDLGEPTTLGRIGVVTNNNKGYFRVTGMEVYARVGDGWALLGSIGEDDLAQFEVDAGTVTEGDAKYHLVRFDVDLLPARVDMLRLRVLSTARPDNAWANIHEVRLYAPEEGARPVELEAAPVRNEMPTESLFVRVAMGQVDIPGETHYDPQIGYLGYARNFIDTLLADGTDIYGEKRSPMFVSILQIPGHVHPGVTLPTIEGQRQNDRAHLGGNLQHDLPLLQAMQHMSAITGDPEYADAADAYLRYFLENCTDTPTGLWPWGEHAHWDFFTDAPGHYIHEYLGQPPLEFWERAWAIRPEAVVGEADGLINHVVNLETFDYNRHADIFEPLPEPREGDMGFLDFPRHGGFFLQTWAFVWSKTGDAKYLDWIERLLDHQDDTRLDSGLLPSYSRKSSTPGGPSVTSTFSCALSMLEAVPLLGDTDTAQRVKRTADGYLEAVLKTTDIAHLTPAFTSHYGEGALAGRAMKYLHAYRLTGDERFPPLARAVAEKYAELEEMPRVHNTPAQVFGSIVNLLLDVHEIDGDPKWVDAAERYAQTGIERLYADGLFRGATDLWYYESELWVSNFVYSLVRLDSVTEDTEHTVPGTAFQR